MILILDWEAKMTASDKTFYKALGQRIVQYRKEQELTQVQLAEKLGIAQQPRLTMKAAVLQIAKTILKPLAQGLNVSIEELIAQQKAG